MHTKWGVLQFFWALISKAVLIAVLIIDVVSYALLGDKILDPCTQLSLPSASSSPATKCTRGLTSSLIQLMPESRPHKAVLHESCSIQYPSNSGATDGKTGCRPLLCASSLTSTFATYRIRGLHLEKSAFCRCPFLPSYSRTRQRESPCTQPARRVVARPHPSPWSSIRTSGTPTFYARSR